MDSIFVDKEVKIKKEIDKKIVCRGKDGVENDEIKLKVDIILQYKVNIKHLPVHYFPINN
jgi:hypothetical protein